MAIFIRLRPFCVARTPSAGNLDIHSQEGARLLSIMAVIGTRPEAVKMAPVLAALERRGARTFVLATGQHADLLPQTVECLDLRIDERLHQADLPHLLAPLQRAIRLHRPAMVVVQGDTRSAFAGAAAAFLENVLVAHVEAGLRTGTPFDPFPEELLRRGIARFAGIHLTPTEASKQALLREGVGGRVEVVGNSVIDALEQVLAKERRRRTPLRRSPSSRPRILVTAHRRENEGRRLKEIVAAAAKLASEGCAVTLFRHPRLSNLSWFERCARPAKVSAPVPHDRFVSQLACADLVVTDSGGVQEEAAYLGRRMLVVRERTERPECLSPGERVLVPPNKDFICQRAADLMGRHGPVSRSSALGTGTSGSRIAEILIGELEKAGNLSAGSELICR
ncbi:UDP-N-acetylglucosamine 2-epimerase (non-hydrolyzing) [Pacificimonas flava]|uniref:UDP-N-acetylglucosamine 2-epimerase (non-hydrolyzing) n=2 Tax=Pacificimonas TaxID=1960290 RepID=A0A219B9V2_9SPHN|nr:MULTISPECIES: UDP-N-acetylglucosamine 2-epimerase (non-hydrolyzing) [Pacificimonas]MBZ6378285.1 UDP-N-acetylglucosamine 2-epimerase (non-hydrolyzing) [Pacificimonas aurantium]OWV34558.1 UDP-N-acetylglucosamine 2-epimerase (non-hydrolyzing) [Pacificimonas flava]